MNTELHTGRTSFRGMNCVLFDLDDTLIDIQTTVDRYAIFLHKEMGLAATYLHAFRQRFQELYRYFYADPGRIFRTLSEEFSFDIPLHRYRENYIRDAWGSTIASDNAGSTLQWLRTGNYRLGVITNGSQETQTMKLKSSGLDTLVEIVVVSEKEGIRKPHPEIFRSTAEKLGVHPCSCIFVGDDPYRDILGASMAGMKTIWLSKGQQWPDGMPAVPDHSTDRLEDILKIVPRSSCGCPLQ